ncbi:MAG: hypothetical protein HUJ99_04405 [Bacteroidaceae bacterium]|nr:hypothetical protein [Bacteroidaceae bacterium]
MDKKKKSGNSIYSYIFSGVTVAGLIAVYLLAGRGSGAAGNTAEAVRFTSTPAATASPTPKPTPTPYGRRLTAVLDDLAFEGSIIEERNNVYLIHQPDANDYGTASLTFDLSSGYVTGFLMEFPRIPEPEDDGSFIAASLKSKHEDALRSQRQAMEALMQAVLLQFDLEDSIPLTTRSEWIAHFINLTISGKGKEDSGDL